MSRHRPIRRYRDACGAAVGIALTAAIGGLLHGAGFTIPWIVAPMGASAVLLFAVPASPLAQPWAIIGGDTLSALAGVLVGHLLGHGVLGCGVGVGLAVAVMMVARCMHPPGGAAALTGVLGGSAVASAGWWFPLAPVALNTILLVIAGLIYHRFSGHKYPHPHGVALEERQMGWPHISDEDLDAVLAESEETYDIDREDLRFLLEAIEARVSLRAALGDVPDDVAQLDSLPV